MSGVCGYVRRKKFGCVRWDCRVAVLRHRGIVSFRNVSCAEEENDGVRCGVVQ